MRIIHAEKAEGPDMSDARDRMPSPRWAWWLIGTLVTGMLIYAGNRVADASHRRYEVRITWNRNQWYRGRVDTFRAPE
jgi:hypothetical protein